MPDKRIVVLGAGPAGLAAALELSEKNVPVTLIELNDFVGGNAASFEIGGIKVDYGSHRLHPAADPQVLSRIKSLLGDELLERPRHGRIRLLGRWIHFPLKPIDLLLRLHPRFSVGVGLDLLKKIFAGASQKNTDKDTFGSVIQRGLGNTICQEFYFPYAKKIWGLDPAEISPIQAYKRISAGSIGKMLLRLLPGGSKGSKGSNTKGIFYYPKRGFGQICEALYDAAHKAGTEFHFNATVTGIVLHDNCRDVIFKKDGETRTISAAQVYSTIPISVLTKLLDPAPPQDVANAREAMSFRAMVLVYLHIQQDQFTEYDAHYFPELEFPFTRISETKNYSALGEPKNVTVLCAEIPVNHNDEIWNMADQALGEVVSGGLSKAGLPISGKIIDVSSKRLPFAYPIYKRGYEEHFSKVDDWVLKQDRMLSFGRQGLYAHDNTHHAMYMARAAAECLTPEGTVDSSAWYAAREVFKGHVVED